MRKNLPKILLSLAIILWLLPLAKAEAAILDDGYLLTETATTSVSGQSPTGNATLKGIVYPLIQGQNPSAAQIYYKSQKVGEATVTQHANFSSQADGEFETYFDQLACGATYKFWLYETPGDTLIQVDTMGGSLTDGFSLPVVCSNGAPPGTPDDQMSPDSAGTEILAGVNWGSIVVTDHSISINGAHVIPFVYGGQKTFKIEYGTGSADNNNQPTGGSFLGFSQNITRNAPYTFSVQIGALVPDTAYYLNLWEVSGVPGEPDKSLDVYNFTMTNNLSSADGLSYTFPSSTSVHVYGNLLNESDQPLSGLPIDIEIHGDNNPNSPAIQSFSTTVGGINMINGSGFYEHTFTGLSADTVYYIFLKQSVSQSLLIGPIQIATPSTYVAPPSPVINPPSYNGLVACDELEVDCNFNTFIQSVNRVINFLIVYVAFPVVALVVAWAGIKLVTSGGKEEAKTQAKSIIRKVLIGFIVALLCWAIIKLILTTLGYVPSGALWEVLGTTPTP